MRLRPAPPLPSKSDPDAPKLPPKPVRELAKALYPYDAQNGDELSIKQGDTIVILTKEVEDEGWWKGELNGKVGVFPDNFVQLIRSEPDLVMSGHSSPQPGKPDRPDKPVKALKPDLTRDKPASSMMGFNPQNQPLPPLPTDSTAPTAAVKGDQASDKPVSKVSPFGPQEGMSMMNAAGIGGRPLLTSQIRRQNGALPVSLIAAQAAERANLNNPHANGGHHDSALTSSSVSTTPQASGNGAGTSSDEAITLDSIESSEGRLKHPTADRARPPARRPPSHIGSPPGHTETIAEENGDSLVGSTSAVAHLNGHNGHSGLNNGQHEDGKRTSIKDLTSKFNEANLGPVPQVINLAGKPFSNGSKLSASSLSKDGEGFR
ncbi:SH3 domain-containing kinase-binding protein 1-like [Galendromus occidentalis]|uniref:SH3 domain-containing kinase-binding protein 1-like n=1 Tax=Galendromus occidentalis TaxID=34638 RepID=A0AAJ7WJB6_9ACAR|nr:SH3 domain-containing kinase-binding protein 1-like [Galendromus occidentalis]